MLNPEKRIKVVYIVSSSYSGSTLLSFLLNTHPEIGTISEFDIMDNIVNDPDFLCSCGEKLRECNFFSRIKRRLNDKCVAFEIDDMNMMFRFFQSDLLNNIFFEKIPKLQSYYLEKYRDYVVNLLPSVIRKKNIMRQRNAAFFSAILEESGACIFLDACKDPYRMKFLFESSEFDLRVIYLIKDGIAGVSSFMKHSQRDIVNATHRWFKEQVTICRLLKEIPDKNKITVQYSDLCRNPETILAGIYNFLNIAAIPVKSFHEVEHHVIGNRMRLSGITEIREDTSWRKRISKSEFDKYLQISSLYIPQLIKYHALFDDYLSKQPELESEIG
ncbi:MAG: sulfotransferase [Pseudomonadota bacterium]